MNQVLLYAKQRYEQPLSAYDRCTQQPSEIAQESEPAVSIHLGHLFPFNPGWIIVFAICFE